MEAEGVSNDVVVDTQKKVQPEKKKRGRPRLPSVERKPRPPGYHNRYYHAHLSFSVKCPYCKNEVVYQKLPRHIRDSKTCHLLRLEEKDSLQTQQVLSCASADFELLD